MLQKVISKTTKGNLEILKNAGLLKEFYLAGGTGLAMQLRHRLSIDLDFFIKKNIDTKALIDKIKKLGNLAVEKESKNTLIGRFQGTKISFFSYDYALLFKLKIIEGVKVADARDVACMKISAVSSRGAKKDFIDLFFILQKITTIEKLLKLFGKKYKNVNYNILHILKSLVYFEDADKEPMPKMLTPVLWKDVKSFMEKNVKNLN